MVDAARPSISARVITNVDEEVRADDRQQHQRGDGDAATIVRVAWRPHQRRHAGFPNKPYGRTASTTASSTNVKMIE